MSISSFLTKKFLKSLFFPAHNRGSALPKKLVKLLKSPPGYWDLPELPDIGSPLSKSGLIAESQKYFSEKIEQLFAVFFGTDEHADINKNEIKTINFFDRITN